MFDDALESLKEGKPILIFDADNREGETDMVIASQFITQNIIKKMRKDGGGLICTTLKYSDAMKFNLPYLEDLFKNCLNMGKSILRADDLKYDKNSTFSITINSRDTFTGIPDVDRSKTVKHFSEFLESMEKDGDYSTEFGKIFRTPGHIHLLIASEGYFKNRRGHTELSTYMMDSAGLIPSATIVEMLSDSGYAMKRDESENYAKTHGYSFVTGEEIIGQWKEIQ